MSTISAPNDLIAAEGGLPPDPFPLVNWRTDVRHEPKQERSIATRKLILDAARSLANENGINGVTMQLVSQRACIASGTAYQFFDDLECIYRDIYEEWYRDWWSVILMYTSEIWTEKWEEQLKALISGSCNFLLKHADSWPVIRHVDATAEGRKAAPMMLNAQIDRNMGSATPYFTSVGLTAKEIEFINRSNVYTARGHHIFVALATTTLSDVIEGSFAAQRALIVEYMRRHNAA
ncbi:MAG: TetR/AcrR family transcriptional regulator [Chloroflexi bacterium]|nr:TetR/AcrR family transcriptional regulator [Chloroflexota bacterium]